MENDTLIFALPKGRICDELIPLLNTCGIEPAADFFDPDSRALMFDTNRPDIKIIRVRAFDVATFVAYGAAQFGAVGKDVLDEFDYDELYAPLDLNIGHCRLSVAMPEQQVGLEDENAASHIRIATKYPHLTRLHYERKGIQAECIKLNGAMEIAPVLGLARRIVDLVSSGATLKANNLVETETILHITSRLIINRTALKTMPARMNGWIETFREAIERQENAGQDR